MLRPDDFIRFINSLARLLKTEDVDALVTVIVVAGALGFFLHWLYYRFLRAPSRSGAPAPPLPSGPDPRIDTLEAKIKELEVGMAELKAERDSLLSEVKADQDVLDRMLANEGEVWRTYDPIPPAGFAPMISFSRPKVIIIANNKGGVGKTTLTAYLAAYFKAKGKRVLVIDLDYQGSISGWLLQAGGITVPIGQPHRLCLANDLLTGVVPEKWPAEVLGRDLDGVELITADPTLTQHEMRLMLRWLRQQGRPDVRYYLAQVLSSQHVQSPAGGFDIVLIDAPPRLTTGVINALVASTHLLVPTKLDPLSAETVQSFLKQAWALRTRLNIGVELAGVVGTMTPAQPLKNRLRRVQLDALGVVQKGLTEWPRDPYIFKRDIQELADIRGVAGRRIVHSGNAGEMFRQLGDELSGRIGL